MKATHNDSRREKASNILKSAGYGAMKSLATSAVHQHEEHDHKDSKKTKIKLATGGCASGGEPKSRLDRKPRAHGGRNKGHKEPKVSVNVINAGGKQPMPVPAMPQKPPMMPPPQATPMPPRPPMPPQGAAPMAPQGMPQKPPGMMNAGGRAKRAAGGPVKNKMDMPHLEGGSGGGLGRLEKAEHESKRKKSA